MGEDEYGSNYGRGRDASWVHMKPDGKGGYVQGEKGGAEVAAAKAFAPPGELAKAVGGGLRYDDGKCRLDLIPPDWEWALGDAMTQGAKKYAERNWEKGMNWSKCLGCIRRHVLKFLLGERYDQETGCHHLALAAWNCLALMSYDLKQLGENDIFDKNRPTVLWTGSAAVNRDGLQDLRGEGDGTS